MPDKVGYWRQTASLARKSSLLDNRVPARAVMDYARRKSTRLDLRWLANFLPSDHRVLYMFSGSPDQLLPGFAALFGERRDAQLNRPSNH